MPWLLLLDIAPSAAGVVVAVLVLRRGPRPRFGAWSALRRQFQRYGTFGGRASRSEHWWPLLLLELLFLALHLVALPLAPGPALAVDILSAVTGAATLLPGFAVSARRLHDTGRSAWWLLLALTVIGIPWVLWWLTRPSQAGPNAWGPEPGTAQQLPEVAGQPRPWTATGPPRLVGLWSAVALGGALLWGCSDVADALREEAEPPFPWDVLPLLGPLLLFVGVVALRGAPLFSRSARRRRVDGPAAPLRSRQGYQPRP